MRNPYIGLPRVNARIGSYANEIEPVVRDLRRIVERWRPDRLARPARDLRYVVDVLLADLLRTLAYVVHLGDAYGTDLLGSDVAARQDFGVHLEPDAGRTRAAWLPPWGGAEAPYPFHAAAAAPIEAEDGFNTGWRATVRCSRLTCAFARRGFVLTPFASPGGELSLGAALTPDDRQFLALAAALFDPARASEAGPARTGGRRPPRPGPRATPGGRHGRAHGLGRGGRHGRCAAERNALNVAPSCGGPGPLLHPGRAVPAGHRRGRPAPGGLGRPRPAARRLPLRADSGGVRRRPGAGRCRGPRVHLRGPQLALVEAVDDLGLPAAIAADLLPFAVGELVNGARPASAGDVAEALARYVRHLPRTRIEDYVAMQVGPGLPLRAPEPPATTGAEADAQPPPAPAPCRRPPGPPWPCWPR